MKNNAETKLRQSLAYIGTQIFVDDASKFPLSGVITIYNNKTSAENEIVFYGSRTDSSFKNLIRGYLGTRQNIWPTGSNIINAVTSDHHNIIKEAIQNIQTFFGLSTPPLTDTTSINARLKTLEAKFLSPKALFQAYPLIGSPLLNVTFQNFSNFDIVKFLWDFGDGVTSTEKSPSHVYTAEKAYTVKLYIITPEGGQAVTIKNNYITVSDQANQPFFYVVEQDPTKSNLSIDTAGSSDNAQTYVFVDQTDGNIIQRYWIFGDDTPSLLVSDPNNHVITHQYQSPGVYRLSLLLVFWDNSIKRVYVDPLTVS